MKTLGCDVATPRGLVCIIGLALMWQQTGICVGGREQPFEAKGKLEYSSFLWSTGTYSARFHVLVDDCQAIVRVKDLGWTNLELWEFGSTGTNSWILEKFVETLIISNRLTVPPGRAVPESAKHLAVPLKQPMRPAYAANLYLRDSPTSTPKATPIWLAYAAKCYLNMQLPGEYLSDNSIFLLPPVNKEHRVKDRAYWRISDENPRFLKSLVALKTDGTLRGSPEYTNAVYIVLAWTNLAGMIVPASFELSLFAIDPHTSLTVPTLAGKVSGKTESFHLLATNLGDIFPKQLAYSARVVDERVAPIDEYQSVFAHVAMDGRVPTLDENKAMAASIKANPARGLKIDARWRRPSTVRIGFFSAVALLSGFLLVKFLRGRNANQQ